MTATYKDLAGPAVGFRFNLKVSGKPDAEKVGFSEMSGIAAELETEPLFAGGENNLTYSLPKQVKTTPLVLKRGLFNVDSFIVQWVKQVINEGISTGISTRDLIVQLVNQKEEIMITWTLHNAYPVKWEISGFNAMDNKLLIESITFNYTNFVIDFK